MAISISSVGPLGMVAIGCAAMAAVILLWYLVRRPSLSPTTKLLLLLGLGVLPLGTAGTGNVIGFEASKARDFCGSCHVMTPYASDSVDPASTSLAARHARNRYFGEENCYACHRDYGMYGTIATKIGGMRHVYEYVFNFRSLTLEEALPRIHIRKPYPNDNCMQCHSTSLPGWLAVADHDGLLDEVRSGEVSCASEGCHGPSHPFSKPAGGHGGKPAGHEVEGSVP
jgi:nitrate/TMAO reductase-like tetraheme cytochrome c subunit